MIKQKVHAMSVGAPPVLIPSTRSGVAPAAARAVPTTLLRGPTGPACVIHTAAPAVVSAVHRRHVLRPHAVWLLPRAVRRPGWLTRAMVLEHLLLPLLLLSVMTRLDRSGIGRLHHTRRRHRRAPWLVAAASHQRRARPAISRAQRVVNNVDHAAPREWGLTGATYPSDMAARMNACCGCCCCCG